ncbi:hypothetical protein MKA48_05240 [[Clostridium] innocuum]|nr:hypothetical protein [[Clostridium] innocuum]
MLIDGHTYVAEDVGRAVKGNVIDIYSSSPELKAYETKIYIKEKE